MTGNSSGVKKGSSVLRILVTGATGLLGTEICRSLSAHHEVVGMVHQRQPIWPLPSFIQADVTAVSSLEHALNTARPDWVIHTVAWTDVDGCERDRSRAYAINTSGTEYLARLCSERGIGMTYISTDYVFDGTQGQAYRETDPPNPINHYGYTKWLGERAVQSSLDRYFILRTAWLFGEFGQNFVSWCVASLRQGRSIPVITDQVGSPTYSRDLAQAVGKLLQTDAYGVYHVVNEGAVSRWEQARQIAAYLDLDGSPLRPVSSDQLDLLAPRPPHTPLSPRRYEQVCGESMRCWCRALEDYLDVLSSRDHKRSYSVGEE